MNTLIKNQKYYIVVNQNELKFMKIKGIRQDLIEAQKLACKLAYDDLIDNEDFIVVTSNVIDKESYLNQENIIITYCAIHESNLIKKQKTEYLKIICQFLVNTLIRIV